jgi:hypothetical protein
VKSVFIVLALALIIASSPRQKTEQSKPALSKADSGLPPGYRQTASPIGVDSATGKIWKEGGPDIHYQIGFTVGEQAREFARQNPKATLTVTRSVATGEIVVALDESQHAMVVSIDGRAHFTARNVQSQKDVVETILIANYVAGFSK